MQDKAQFLGKYGITIKFEELEKQNSNLWEELFEIHTAYKEQKEYLENTMNSFISSIGNSKSIHSIRYRIKDADSLIVKIIEKSMII